MNEIEIPILKKSYDLYKLLHECGKVVPKQDRYTIYEQSGYTILLMIECFFEAGYTKPNDKRSLLVKGNNQLGLLRFLLRLMKETKSLDNKKYIQLQIIIDEIGRMLGGWIRSIPQ